MCLSCAIEEVTGIALGTDEAHDELEALKEKHGGRIPWPEATDEMIECAAYIQALYKNPAGGTGGPLHIAVDDNNLEDSNLEFCRNQIEDWFGYNSSEEQDAKVKSLSHWILDLLDPMDQKQRQVAVELAGGSLREVMGKVYMPATEFPIREEIRDEAGNYVGMQWGFRTRVVEEGWG